MSGVHGGFFQNAEVIKTALRRQENNICDNLEDTITDTYTHDYNILHVHDVIMKKFKYCSDKDLKTLQTELKHVEGELQTPQHIVQYNHLRRHEDELRKNIKRLQDDVDKKEYLAKATPILDEYKSKNTRRTVTFGSKKTITTEDLCPIIEKYLLVAKKYININVTRELPTPNNCGQCGSLNIEMCTDETNGGYCVDCGYSDSFFGKIPDITVKSDYEDRGNFNKILTRFQGKQKNKVSNSLYALLEEYFDAKYQSGNVSKQPLNIDGTRGETNIHIMAKALKTLGKTAYMEDIYLICRNYWEWVLFDLSDIEEKIIQDYDMTQEAFRGLANIKRISSINANYRLFKHLEAYGVKCSIKYFRIPDKIRDYDDIWKKMVEGARKKGCQIEYKQTF